MAGEKRFRISMFGFKKSDVNYYFEKIIKDYEEKLIKKDEENNIIKTQGTNIRLKYEDLSQKYESAIFDKSKIADTLLSAHMKADEVIEEAVNHAREEKSKLEVMIEIEREKLIDIKSEIKALKASAASTIRSYEAQLSKLVEKDIEEEIEEEMAI